MDKALAVSLSFFLLMTLIPMGASANGDLPSSSSIRENGNSLFLLDPKTTHPDNYAKITGFELTIELLEPALLGGQLPISALMVARGDHPAEAFAFDYSGGIPKYVCTAREFVTFTDSDLGSLFFLNSRLVTLNDGTVTVKFEGEKALFTPNINVLTAYGVYGSFMVTNVNWILGDPEESYPDDESAYQPVETIRYNDIPTVENGSIHNYVDIEVPAIGQGPYPVVMWIHGGGWTGLSRKSVFVSDTMNYLVSKGYAVVYAEYSLSQDLGDGMIEGSFPQNIYDLKAAVRFIRANAEQYNLNTDYIVAMGESAGGHLSMLLGTTNGNPDYEDLSMGYAEYSSDVQVMVSYFGPKYTDGLFAYALLGSEHYEDKELYEAASPYVQLTEHAPPLFMTHGENDQLVGIEQSRMMEVKAKELLGDDQVTTLYFEDGPHASRSVFDAKEVMEAIESFITKHYSKYKPNVAISLKNIPYLHRNEDGIFEPDKPVTRAEQAAILATLLADQADYSGVPPYADVTPDHRAEEAIEKVSAYGLMGGGPDGTFGPEQTVTRAEMAELAVRLRATDSSPGDGFKDTVGHPSESAIKAAQGAGYINGYPEGNFRPDQKLKRAEAVVILNRVLGIEPIRGEFHSPWKDVSKDHWAARDIAAATVVNITNE